MLFDEMQWAQIVDTLGGFFVDSAELNYYYGSAAAQLGQWDEARGAFLAGLRLDPKDKRFPIELGGVAFRQKRYPEAATWLRRGLRLDPQDGYASEFIATIYFLNGNFEAALKYWNRIGKPEVDSIHTAGLRVHPELIDRAFTFAPASMLRLPEFLTTEERIDGLGIFSAHNFQLAMRNDGKFDVDFIARERNGIGSGWIQGLFSMFRGVVYQTIYPEYYNIGRSATNLNSLLRWDSQKRRVFASLSTPLRANPKYRLQAGADLRNENWEVRQPAPGPEAILDAVNMRRETAEVSFTSFSSGRLSWHTGAEFSHRDYRNAVVSPALAQQAFLSGYQLKHFVQADVTLLRLPERRWTSTLTFSSQTGTIWSSPAHTFEKLQAGVTARWLPQMTGDDYATELQVRSGRTFGQIPFDELYVLGLERDTPLRMRAHRGTRGGRKGNAPLGRNYFLSNLEADKNIWERGFTGIKLSPFLDTGKTSDSVAELGSRRWLWDTGLQAKVRLWGIGFMATYGKDLRSGKNAYYLTAGR